MRLIDADKLKEELGKSWAFENTLYDVCRIINEAPTIEARPKGGWVSEGRVYPPTNAYNSAYCSHCGEWSEYLTDYCGNCGADMREETDHE